MAGVRSQRSRVVSCGGDFGRLRARGALPLEVPLGVTVRGPRSPTPPEIRLRLSRSLAAAHLTGTARGERVTRGGCPAGVSPGPVRRRGAGRFRAAAARRGAAPGQDPVAAPPATTPPPAALARRSRRRLDRALPLEVPITVTARSHFAVITRGPTLFPSRSEGPLPLVASARGPLSRPRQDPEPVVLQLGPLLDNDLDAVPGL
jgi:hypothetical protein